LTDSAILELSISGDSEAFQELVRRYFFKAKKLARTFELSLKDTGISLEDIQTVAFEALLTAYDKFGGANGASFYNFWKNIAIKQISSYMESNSYSYKAMMFRGKYSFDQHVPSTTVKYEEVLGENDVYLSTMPERIDQMEIMVKFLESLTPMEKEIYDLLVKGYSREEMAKTLNIPIKTVYSRIKRIKQKYRKLT